MQVMLTICPVVLTQYIFTVNIAVVFKGLMLYFWIVDKWLDCSAPRREVQLPLHVTGDPGTLVCTPVWPCYIQVSEMILLSSEACTFWFSFLLKVFLLGFHLYIYIFFNGIYSSYRNLLSREISASSLCKVQLDWNWWSSHAHSEILLWIFTTVYQVPAITPLMATSNKQAEFTVVYVHYVH